MFVRCVSKYNSIDHKYYYKIIDTDFEEDCSVGAEHYSYVYTGFVILDIYLRRGLNAGKALVDFNLYLKYKDPNMHHSEKFLYSNVKFENENIQRYYPFDYELIFKQRDEAIKKYTLLK